MCFAISKWMNASGLAEWYKVRNVCASQSEMRSHLNQVGFVEASAHSIENLLLSISGHRFIRHVMMEPDEKLIKYK